MVELDNGIKIRVGYDDPKTEERIDKLMNIAKNGVVANVKTVVESKDVKSLEKQLSNVSSNIDTKELTKSITSAIKEGIKEITNLLKGKDGNFITVNFNPQQIVDAYNSAIKQINPNKINPVKVQVEADSDTIKKEIKKASTTKNKSKSKKSNTEVVDSGGTKIERPKQKIDNSKRHDFTPVFTSQSGFNKLKKNKSAVESLNNYGLALKTGNISLINSTSDELERKLNELKIKFEKKDPEKGYVLREKINKQSAPDKENSELIKSLREISLDNFDREFIIATNNLRDELNKSFNNTNIVNALKETERVAKSKGIDFDFSEYISRYSGELGTGKIEKVTSLDLNQNLSSDTQNSVSNRTKSINELRLESVRRRKDKEKTRKPTIISDTEENSAATSFVKPYHELAEDLRKAEIDKKVKKSDSRYKDVIDVINNLRTSELKKSFNADEMGKLFSQRIYEVFNGENIDIGSKKLSDYIGKYEGKPITKGIAINNDEEQRMEEISEIIKAGGISEDEKKSLLDEFGALRESRLSGFKTAGKYYKEAVNRITIFEQNMGESASDFYTIVDNIYSASKDAIKNKDKEKASELLLDLTNMVASSNGDETKLNYITGILSKLKSGETEKVIKSEIGSTGFTGDIPERKLSKNPTIKAKQLVENLKDDISSGVKPDVEKFEEEYNETRELVAKKQKRELKRGKNGAFVSTTKSISATDSEKNAVLKELSKTEKVDDTDTQKNVRTNHIKFEDFKRLIDLSNSQKPAEFEEFNKYLNENANVNELFKSYGRYFEGITAGVKAEQLSWFEELSPKFGIKSDATEANIDSLLKRLVYSSNNKSLVGYDKDTFTKALLDTIEGINIELSKKDINDDKLVGEIVKETKTKKSKKSTKETKSKSTNEIDAIYGRLKLFTAEQLSQFDDDTFNNILEDSKKLVGEKYNDVLQKIATVGAKRLSKSKQTPNTKNSRGQPLIEKVRDIYKQVTDNITNLSGNDLESANASLRTELERISKSSAYGKKIVNKVQDEFIKNTPKNKTTSKTKSNEVDSIYGRLKLFTPEQLSSFDNDTFNKILEDSKKLVGAKYNDTLQKIATEALNRTKPDVTKLSDKEVKTQAREAWNRKVTNKPPEPTDNDVIVENEKRINAKAGSKATIGINLGENNTPTKSKKRDISRYEAMVNDIESLFGATSDLAKKAKFYLSNIEQYGFRAGGGDELNKIFKDNVLPILYKKAGLKLEEPKVEENTKPAWYKRLGAFSVGTLGSMLQGGVSKFFGLLQGVLNKIKGFVTNLMKNIINAAVNPFKKSIKLFTGAIKSAGGKSKALSSLSELLLMPLVLAVEFTMLPVLKKLIPAIKDTMNWVAKSRDKFTLLGEAIANVASKVYNMLTGNFVLGFEKFFNTLTKYKSEINGEYSSDETFFTNLNNAGVSLKNISNNLGTVATVADNLNKELINFGKDNPEYGSIVTAFADEIGNALFNSITTSTESIWTAFDTVLNNDEAYSHLQSFLNGLIQSLGKNIETTSKIGAEFVDQLTKGINNYLDSEEGSSTLTNISQNLAGIISKVMSSLSTEVIPTVISSGAVGELVGATAPIWLNSLLLGAVGSGATSALGSGVKALKNKILTGSTTGGIATNLGKSTNAAKTEPNMKNYKSQQKALNKAAAKSEPNLKNLGAKGLTSLSSLFGGLFASIGLGVAKYESLSSKDKTADTIVNGVGSAINGNFARASVDKLNELENELKTGNTDAAADTLSDMLPIITKEDDVLESVDKTLTSGVSGTTGLLYNILNTFGDVSKAVTGTNPFESLTNYFTNGTFKDELTESISSISISDLANDVSITGKNTTSMPILNNIYLENVYNAETKSWSTRLTKKTDNTLTQVKQINGA